MLSTLLTNYKFTGDYKWLNNLFDVLNPVLYAIMAVVGAAGAIYAIVLGVNLARAEDQSKRDEAKKRLVTTLIAVAITIALVLFFTQLLPYILQLTLKSNIDGNVPADKGSGSTTGSIKLVINMARAIIGK